jgi:crotonobetainyl-CoA:carnitine CoA-transferase CaiB-like acyl-CoA transferase
LPRVIEVGQIVSGPFAGLVLSELGFEVIKVEQPGKGDISRHLTGSSVGNFAFLNMGKKSITIDLKKEKGKEIFLRLVSKSDIVIDNLGPDTMQKLQLGYDALSQINPMLIYLKIKGFGPGPYAWRKSLDYPAEVESGIAYMNGLEDRPMRLGASVIDIFAATLGVIFVLKSMIDRMDRKRGFYAEVPLFESAVYLMGQHMASAQVLGRELKPLNSEPFTWGIYDFFETSDGKKVFLAVTTDSQWEDFCKSFNLQDLYSSSELRTNAGRYKNRDWLIPRIASLVREMTMSELLAKLDESNVAYGILNKSLDLVENEQLKYDAKMALIRNQDGKIIYVPRLPVYNMQGTTVFSQKLEDPPLLGEDNEELLRELGYSDIEIDELKREGAI